jgi:hypothetical protein
LWLLDLLGTSLPAQLWLEELGVFKSGLILVLFLLVLLVLFFLFLLLVALLLQRPVFICEAAWVFDVALKIAIFVLIFMLVFAKLKDVVTDLVLAWTVRNIVLTLSFDLLGLTATAHPAVLTALVRLRTAQFVCFVALF